MAYDAVVLLGFGGPERPEDVMPFLQNVTRGRGVPPERLAEVAEHYQHFGGVSPINQQHRDLLAAIRADFAANGLDLPVYWGNRNWHPMLADTVTQMRDDGVTRALAFVTSAYGGYSSCRQYQEDIAAARAAVGPDAPVIEKLRQFWDHPGFVEPHADAVRSALDQLDPARRDTTRLVFTAHSVPVSMAANAGPHGGRYEAQLRETARLVAAAAAPDLPYDLVWQSRSGPPQVPWLEPDVNDHLAALAEAGTTSVVVSPIGFVSDHLEVVWDLDTEARQTAKQLGLDFVRAGTPGTDPRFVAMVRELVAERIDPDGARLRRRLGELPLWDTCPAVCCVPARRP
ncbi:ferrochelatase [Micromonospora globbae]|jgi:ferrochelatase|uniref:Coproporphyrin III ferrochelatase n=1 Tax=Micromonospora globbae TaxID=1894969 RepID=A0A420ET16_9ACTN|nr:ferrochelatase [Micromonospora globbae]RKF23818.1 ferrochelatase [Micromonospora globbae]WTF84522.1 ferrochelatase [Micromonospora globbae]